MKEYYGGRCAHECVIISEWTIGAQILVCKISPLVTVTVTVTVTGLRHTSNRNTACNAESFKRALPNLTFFVKDSESE